MKKRVLSLIMALAMVFSVLPATAFAADTVVEVADKDALTSAIQNAADGTTIKLTADITSDAVLLIDKPITLDLGGNTLTTTNAWGGLQLKNGCSVKNGKLLHTGRVNAIKVWDVVSIEDLVIEVTDTTEGKTVGGIAIQKDAAGVDSIKNVTMQGVGLDYGIETYECGNATEPVIGSMENVTIDATGTGMLISAPCGTATNCSISGGTYGINMQIKGTYSATLELVDCEVTGGELAVWAHDEGNESYTHTGKFELIVDDATTFDGELELDDFAAADDVEITDLSPVAEINGVNYRSLKSAVKAAKGDDTIKLLKDVELDEKLDITVDVTIEGEHTITRANDYTGTLFEVKAGATLTLDGGLTIDGGNAWTYTKIPLDMDMANGDGTYVGNHITPAEGGVNATASLIVNKGTLNANEVTIENSYSTSGVSAIDCGENSKTILDGATMQNIAANRSGAVVYVGGADAVLTIKGDTRITGNFGIGNGGIIQNYGQGTTVNMEDGSIDNNHIGKSGTLYASYSSNANKMNTFNMSGGVITQNVMEGYGPVYIHTNTVWNMTGGEVSENISYLPSYVRGNNNSFGNISGGKIVNNEITGTDYSNGYYVTRPDIYLGVTGNITGGTFTQDVSEYCHDSYAPVNNGDGTWSVDIDPEEAVCEMDGEYFLTIKDALDTLRSADTETHTLTVLKDHEIDVNYSTYNYPILVNGFSVVLDLNGKTITADWSKYAGSRADNALIGLANGGKLTVIDSSEEQTGTIRNMSDGKDDVENRIFWLSNAHATKEEILTIEGGTFIQEEDINLLYVEGVPAGQEKAGYFTYINGGNFQMIGYNDFFNSYDGRKQETIISGGTFNVDPTDWETKFPAGYIAAKGTEGLWSIQLDTEKTFVAKIGNGYYETIAAAVEAANTAGTATIELLADIAEDITIVQKEGVDITLDGGEHTFSGTIYIEGQSRNNGEETLTIQNFVFSTTEATHDFISCNSTESAKRYAHNVTIQDCAFSAELEAGDENAVVGMRFRQCYNITVKNVTAEGMHSLMWTTGSDGMMIEEVMIADCLGGISFGTTKNVTVKDSVITAVEEGGHGLRFDGSAAGENAVENCEIEADIPVLVRNAKAAGYLLTITGADTVMTATGEGGCVVVTTGDTDTEGYPTEPDGTYVSIDAGTYNVEPKAKYIADGNKAFDLQNGTWSVMPENVTVTVTFKSEGTTVEEQVISYAGTATSVHVTRDGYTFEGWYLGDELFDFDTIITEPITLVGQWTVNVYRITYVTAGGTVYDPVTEYTYGVGAMLPTHVGRAGCSFEGWYDNAACMGTRITSISATAMGDKVFYAKWSRTAGTVLPDRPQTSTGKPDASCSGGTTCPMYPFADLNTALWYHDGIHFVLENNLMNGIGADIFAPDTATSRAMIVTILWRLEGKPVVNSAMSFDDVAAGTWYTEAVRWAASAGIVEGYNAAVFGPNDMITREQLATVLWRYAKYRGIDVSVGENVNILSYDDAFDVSAWAIPAMQWACGEGLVQGIASNGTMNLDPTGIATRAQSATILYRFCSAAMK